jgi:hypothetical protein
MKTTSWCYLALSLFDLRMGSAQWWVSPLNLVTFDCIAVKCDIWMPKLNKFLEAMFDRTCSIGLERDIWLHKIRWDFWVHYCNLYHLTSWKMTQLLIFMLSKGTYHCNQIQCLFLNCAVKCLSRVILCRCGQI